ncbi:hemerythrin domain-containing protein [Undibacterium sp. Ji42W]|uniref:hemerythrin domain-containing protein n=1 Tax=Undibacterium sp. Ji42W TaxID=3413039 RepID=UPI003BF2D55D
MSVRNIYPASLRIIQDEHEHLSSVIQGMRYFVRHIDSGGNAPGLKVFRAMLYYIMEYPEKVHHPKEDQYLFAKIKERTHQLDSELDALSEQHSKGELMAHRLFHALLDYEFAGKSAFVQFRDLVEQYALFYFTHMRAEEERIMPVARQVLNDKDWKEVDAAFMENKKMLDDAGQYYKYEELFSLIVNISPAPIGVGDRI